MNTPLFASKSVLRIRSIRWALCVLILVSLAPYTARTRLARNTKTQQASLPIHSGGESVKPLPDEPLGPVAMGGPRGAVRLDAATAPPVSEVEPNDSPAGAQAAPFNQRINGTIATTDPGFVVDGQSFEDWYSFTLASPGTIAVDLSDNGTKDLDIWLYHASGPFTDPIGGSAGDCGSHEIIPALQLDPGDYVVAVDAFPNPNCTADSATPYALEIINPAQVDLALTKSHTGTFVAGTNGVYSMTVTNVGWQTTSSPITVTDELPSGLGYVSGVGDNWSFSVSGQTVTATRAISLAPGTPSTFSLTVAVLAGAVPGVTNTASVETQGDANASNDSASDPTTVGAPAADLAVTLTDSTDPVATGAQLVYTVSVQNAGPDIASDVVVRFPTPAGSAFSSASSSQGTVSAPSPGGSGTVTASLGSVAAGTNATVTTALIVTAASGSVLTATATVESTTADANTANNSATQSTAVTAATTHADLSIVAGAPSGEIQPGSPLGFTIEVTNNGPAVATGVVVFDSVPSQTTFLAAGTSQGFVTGPPPGGSGTASYQLGSLAPGATANLTFFVMVEERAVGIITNSAAVTSGLPDPNTANNESSASVIVASAVDPPLATSVRALGSPFRLRIGGSNFQPGLVVTIADQTAPWPNVKVSDSKVVLGRGRALRTYFPKGIPVAIRIQNPDGGTATVEFTR